MNLFGYWKIGFFSVVEDEETRVGRVGHLFLIKISYAEFIIPTSQDSSGTSFYTVFVSSTRQGGVRRE